MRIESFVDVITTDNGFSSCTIGVFHRKEEVAQTFIEIIFKFEAYYNNADCSFNKLLKKSI